MFLSFYFKLLAKRENVTMLTIGLLYATLPPDSIHSTETHRIRVLYTLVFSFLPTPPRACKRLMVDRLVRSSKAHMRHRLCFITLYSTVARVSRETSRGTNLSLSLLPGALRTSGYIRVDQFEESCLKYRYRPRKEIYWRRKQVRCTLKKSCRN